MTSPYAHGAALQVALYESLSTDPAIGVPVFDAAPAGEVPATFVALGPETIRDASDGSGAGTRHDVTISVVTDEPGFAQAKRLAGQISHALTETPPVLTEGHLVGIWFRKGRSYRTGKARARRIDLTFRARIDD